MRRRARARSVRRRRASSWRREPARGTRRRRLERKCASNCARGGACFKLRHRDCRTAPRRARSSCPSTPSQRPSAMGPRRARCIGAPRWRGARRMQVAACAAGGRSSLAAARAACTSDEDVARGHGHSLFTKLARHPCAAARRLIAPRRAGRTTKSSWFCGGPACARPATRQHAWGDAPRDSEVRDRGRADASAAPAAPPQRRGRSTPRAACDTAHGSFVAVMTCAAPPPLVRPRARMRAGAAAAPRWPVGAADRASSGARPRAVQAAAHRRAQRGGTRVRNGDARSSPAPRRAARGPMPPALDTPPRAARRSAWSSIARAGAAPRAIFRRRDAAAALRPDMCERQKVFWRDGRRGVSPARCARPRCLGSRARSRRRPPRAG